MRFALLNMPTRFWLSSTTIAMALACCLPSHAEPPTELFEIANKLYYEGKFNEAATNYEKLVHSGQTSPAIYFNLGNASLKAGQIGRAIAAYQKAKELSPRDPDILANLGFARNQVQGPSFSIPRWERSLAKLTLNEWTLLASVCIWLLFILLIATMWRASWKRSLRGALYVLAIFSIGLSACAASAFYRERSLQLGVITAREVSAHRGPLEESETTFVLHDGAEVRVLDRKENWFLITTGPRYVGWIPSDRLIAATNSL